MYPDGFVAMSEKKDRIAAWMVGEVKMHSPTEEGPAAKVGQRGGWVEVQFAVSISALSSASVVEGVVGAGRSVQCVGSDVRSLKRHWRVRWWRKDRSFGSWIWEEEVREWISARAVMRVPYLLTGKIC